MVNCHTSSFMSASVPSRPPSSPATIRTHGKGRYGDSAKESEWLCFRRQIRQRPRQRYFVAHGRGEFETEDALVAELLDLVQYERIIRFALEHLMPSRHARRMEVANNVDIPLDVIDEVAFHNLHVVAVEEYSQALGTDSPADLRTQIAAGEPVVGMVVFVVQRFQEQGHACFLRHIDDRLGPFDD